MTKDSELLKRYERLCNQNASIYADEAILYKTWNTILNGISVVFSAFLLTLALGSDEFFERTVRLVPDATKWLLAILSFLNFSVVLILLIWQPGVKATLNHDASKHYSQLRRRIQEAQSLYEAIPSGEIEQIAKEYNDNDGFPLINDSRFLGAKRRHLIKVAISKEISMNPSQSIREIKRRLMRQKVTPVLGNGQKASTVEEDSESTR